MKNRRDFFKTAGIGAAAAALWPSALSAKSADLYGQQANIEVGLASISMSKLSFEEMLATAKRIGLRSVSLKSMHAPLDSSKEKLAAIRATAEYMGMKIVSAGVIYLKSKEEIDQAFEYAKALGLPRIVGVPNYDLIDYVEEKVKQYDICMAIHNHGPDNLPYETPYVAYDKVKTRDKRVGLCIDPGHVVRVGIDPAEAVKKVADRLQEMHFWDVSKAEKEGVTCTAGTGVMNIPALVKMLKKIGFNGYMNIEYLGNPEEDRILNVANTAGYLKGIIKAV